VGSAVLLAILIVLTPNLLTTGSPGVGNLATQAELLIDRAPSNTSMTHLYLHALGLVRYYSLTLSWAPLPGPDPPASLAGLNWTDRATGDGLLELEGSTAALLFAVNATAVYIDSSGAGATYAGDFAFQWVGSSLIITPYGDTVGAGPTDQSQLPLALFLTQGPYGGRA
jgi:hypothetical protein